MTHNVWTFSTVKENLDYVYEDHAKKMQTVFIPRNFTARSPCMTVEDA